MTSKTKNLHIAEQHASFPGHFPGHAILPGVLLLERVMSFAEEALGKPITAFSLNNAKFLAPVMPNDYITIDLVTVTEHDYKFTVHIDATQTLALSGQLKIAS